MTPLLNNTSVRRVEAGDYRLVQDGDDVASMTYCPPAREWYGWVLDAGRAVGPKMTAGTMMNLRAKLEAAL